MSPTRGTKSHAFNEPAGLSNDKRVQLIRCQASPRRWKTGRPSPYLQSQDRKCYHRGKVRLVLGPVWSLLSKILWNGKILGQMESRVPLSLLHPKPSRRLHLLCKKCAKWIASQEPLTSCVQERNWRRSTSRTTTSSQWTLSSTQWNQCLFWELLNLEPKGFLSLNWWQSYLSLIRLRRTKALASH